MPNLMPALCVTPYRGGCNWLWAAERKTVVVAKRVISACALVTNLLDVLWGRLVCQVKAFKQHCPLAQPHLPRLNPSYQSQSPTAGTHMLPRYVEQHSTSASVFLSLALSQNTAKRYTKCLSCFPAIASSSICHVVPLPREKVDVTTGLTPTVILEAVKGGPQVNE